MSDNETLGVLADKVKVATDKWQALKDRREEVCAELKQLNDDESAAREALGDAERRLYQHIVEERGVEPVKPPVDVTINLSTPFSVDAETLQGLVDKLRNE